MGVAGSGKTTVGGLLARELGWDFADADDFHSAANIAKMAAGQPLTDEDRAPWLAALRAHAERHLAANRSAVIACSALKESYRRILMADSPAVRLVHLHGSRELLLSRLGQRQGHFMKPNLLDSQLAALEPSPQALTIDISRSPAELVAEIRRAFGV